MQTKNNVFDLVKDINEGVHSFDMYLFESMLANKLPKKYILGNVTNSSSADLSGLTSNPIAVETIKAFRWETLAITRTMARLRFYNEQALPYDNLSNELEFIYNFIMLNNAVAAGQV